MEPLLAMEILAAVGLAVMVVRYWRVVVAFVAVVVLSLTLIGVMTVVSNWPR
jgi:hypothetical protein